MIDRFVTLIGRWLARNRGRALQDRLFISLERAYQSAQNFNYFELEKNGEAWLIRQACKNLPIKTVMDIGANRGEWLKIAFDSSTSTEIIACEPQPPLATKLALKYEGQSRIKILAAAIGSEDGAIDLHCYEGNELANAFGWQHAHKKEVIKVPLRNGVHLVAEQGWDGIDLLKVDVEGMEMDVLLGFKELIEQSKIGIVQFEFGAFSLHVRTLLKDYYDLFGEHYRIGRLMPNGIAFTDYDFHSETSEFANYVACRKDWVEAISR